MHVTGISGREATFTPGPWRIEAHYSKALYEVRPRYPVAGFSAGFAAIARVAGDKRTVDDTVRAANARLIGASPEMFALLHELSVCLASRMTADDTEAHTACTKAHQLTCRILGEPA